MFLWTFLTERTLLKRVFLTLFFKFAGLPEILKTGSLSSLLRGSSAFSLFSCNVVF